MKHGDSLVVIEGEYTGYTGQFVDLTHDGLIVVEFGAKWRAAFHPHDLELAEGFTLRRLLVERYGATIARPSAHIPSRED